MITAREASESITQCVKPVDIIPVLVVDDPVIAMDLAKVLVDAGLPVLEVTLRTPNALCVMEKMAAVEGAIVAAGTVLNQSQVVAAQSAGASFLVSPGFTEPLYIAAMQADMPLLPGVATASEVMQMAELGFSLVKFFPAQTNGGVSALSAFSGPFPHMSFCPTGGINPGNINDYLGLGNVACVGGSWLVGEDDLRKKDWRGIAQKALAMGR